MAQSGTNSPYSQYGLGVMADQSQAMNRGMGGLAMGLRAGDKVNFLNPASYSAVDSLTMVFDVGLSLQVTNFKEGGSRMNANNADFEYAVASFRAVRNVGVSFGIVPFTNIGYDYSSSSKQWSSDYETYQSFTSSYEGTGGLHQAYIGAGWQFIPGWSIGANIGYLWGSYDKSASVASSDGYVNTVTRTYVTTVKSYKIDVGLQGQFKLSKRDVLTIGAAYTFGHNLGADAESQTLNVNSQTSVYTGDTVTLRDAFRLPTIIRVGFAWTHAGRLTAGFDYTLQKWGGIDMPETNDATGAYVMKSGLLKDRHQYTVGAEYVRNPLGRKYIDHIRYRVGASLATPYVRCNGIDAPTEYSVSAGLGIPIMNSYNNRSIVNVSASWTRASSSALISENTFRINVGVTFNERWFMKWKVD